MALPKWNEERTAKLQELVVGQEPVSQEVVAKIAEVLETTNRSISSKLRKMGVEVVLASAGATKTFTDTQAVALADFVETNAGEYTYGQIAERFEAGVFSPKQIQGKILSMELTENVKPTPKAEAVRTYTEAEETVFLEFVAKGSFLEEIADALGKELNSVRGKALSFLRAGEIEAIPKQRDVKGKDKTDALEELGDVSTYTVEKLAEVLGKTPRGIRTMLTRRGITITDHDGAAKKAKAVSAE
jgi:DNA-directed RNA polymerase subunit F